MAGAGDERFDLRAYLRTLRRRRTLIVLVTAGVVASATAVSLLQPTVYAASAEVVLQPRSTESVFSSNSNNFIAASVETEVRVLESDAVRASVRRQLGSAPSVTAKRVGETEVMKITAEENDAARSARIANAYANAYIDYRKTQAVGDLTAATEQISAKIDELQVEIDALDRRLATAAPGERDGVQAAIGPRYTNLLTQQGLLAQKFDSLKVDATLKSGGAQLVSAAAVPKSPASPKPVRNAVAAVFVGLVLGIGLAFVREHLDDSVRNKDDLSDALPDVPVLGVVPVIAKWDQAAALGHFQSLRSGSSPAAEAYRTLRTAVQLLGVERPLRTLQITSSEAGEGKTTLLANLAVVLAAAGQRVLMIDCDLRRPRLHDLFRVPNDIGFTSYFLGDRTAQSTVQPVSVDGSIFLVTAGPTPANPSELLSSKRTAEFVFELQDEYDVILVDSAPVLPVADAVVLAAWVEGTLLVANAGVTTRPMITEAFDRLRQVDANVVGSVLNRATGDAMYGYGYSYTDDGAKRGKAEPPPVAPQRPDRPARP